MELLSNPQEVTRFVQDLVIALRNSGKSDHLQELESTINANVAFRQQIADELVRHGFANDVVENLKECGTKEILNDASIRQKVDSMYSLLWNCSDYSTNFCRALSEAGIHRVFDGILQCIRRLLALPLDSHKLTVMLSTVSVIWNMLRRRNHRYYTVDDDTKITLIHFSTLLTRMPQIKLVCVCTVVFTANEAEMALLDDLNREIISLIMDRLKSALSSTTGRYDSFSVTELLDAAAGFGRFPSQITLLNDAGFLNLVIEACQSPPVCAGQLESALEALKVLFSDRIRDEMVRDLNIDGVLRTLETHESPDVSTLAKQLLQDLHRLAGVLLQ